MSQVAPKGAPVPPMLMPLEITPTIQNSVLLAQVSNRGLCSSLHGASGLGLLRTRHEFHCMIVVQCRASEEPQAGTGTDQS